MTYHAAAEALLEVGGDGPRDGREGGDGGDVQGRM